MNCLIHKQSSCFASVACLAGLLVMIGSSCQNSHVVPDGIRRSEISALPSNATFSLVIDKFGWTLTDTILRMSYPAAEGGRYLFLYCPTNEIDYPKDANIDDLPLIAVVKLDKHHDGLDKKGTYVFPRTMEGKNFTGIDFENNTWFDVVNGDQNGNGNTQSPDDSNTVIYAVVQEVKPVPGPRFSMKRWSVRLNIVKVINKGTAFVEKGETVDIFVHSVIKTFSMDVDQIVGKTFKIIYLEPFDNKYDDDIQVIAADEPVK